MRLLVRSTTKRHHVPIHNSKADLRFLTFLTLPHDVAKEGGLIQSGHSSFPFRFDRVRDTKLLPVTCLRGATALCFQPLLFPHVWWSLGELKDTLTERFFRKRRRADRQHELQQSSRGFRLVETSGGFFNIRRTLFPLLFLFLQLKRKRMRCELSKSGKKWPRYRLPKFVDCPTFFTTRCVHWVLD